MTEPTVVNAAPVPESRLARNSLLNLLGQGVPLIAAFFAIPKLITGLGTERFGLLTLAWLVIGYFSLFDLGLGRALTQVVAAEIRDTRDTKAPLLVWADGDHHFVHRPADAVTE